MPLSKKEKKMLWVLENYVNCQKAALFKLYLIYMPALCKNA